MKKLLKIDEGFTIIEVTLVLAIAGLIFLVVFLALPQLQKSQRDSVRKSDVGRLIAAIATQAANAGSGGLPSSNVRQDVLAAGYIDNFSPYTVSNSTTALDFTLQANEPGVDAMVVVVGSTCDGNSSTNRAFAVATYQENGPAYCEEG